MNRISSLAAGTALSTILAGAAAADVSPREVWDSWSGYFTGFGYEVNATESESSGRLDVSGLTLGMDLPEGEGRLDMMMGDIAFIDQGDGTVRIELPAQMPIKAKASGEGETADVSVLLTYTDMNMVASGAPLDITYVYDATEASVALTELVVNGEAVPDVAFELSLMKLAGMSSMTIGDMIGIEQKFSAELMTFNVDVKDPEGETVDMNASVAGLDFAGRTNMPSEIDPDDPAAMFANGFKVDGDFKHGATDVKMAVTEGAGTTNIDMSAGGGSLAVILSEEQMAYSGGTTDLTVNIMGPEIPLPVSFAAGQFGYGFDVPLMAKDEPQDFALKLSLVDLTMADMLWGIFDPAGVLPRDPATLTFDMTGLATVLIDLMSPEAEEMSAPPGELNAITLNDLTIKLAGASANGTGAFTFDNSDLESFDGMPRPEGELNVTIMGANGLIDKLVQMGLVPEEQAMGARMMMGMFAVPGAGEDELNSKIEVNAQGHVLANGQRIK
ncbi:DUF2125 domain-containing protein [Shimia biformata]|uniref:DUF2125 domain-containing protein n=1 Tax=Shimia biformata TaxID=1294299 RepID=UPI0019510A98|nr:DUF2125 domain-containing protein [Shimia biformata]